ncbi:MAG: hypothetical protein PVG86_11125 [Desulfobacterales bacterium]
MKILTSLLLFCLLSTWVLFFVACSNREENLKRERIAIRIKSQIEHYYNQNGFYPESLGGLPISTDTDFISYDKGGVFRYTSQKGDQPWYHFIWVYDGMLKRQGSDHGLSWNGKQCGNDKTHLVLMSKDSQPDSNGFFSIDLH